MIEGQFLSKRAHAERFGMPSPPIRIIATGGASANDNILSLISSIFGCDVYTVQRPGKTCYLRISCCCFLAYSLIIGKLFVCVFVHRFSITWSCTESCSWLALQQKRNLCAHLLSLRGEIGEDVSKLQAQS